MDMVLRADVYVGERDTFGIGFSDNVIFRKQFYLRAGTRPHPNVVSPHRRAVHAAGVCGRREG